MKERPILFSAPMVRALLEGRKSQTRRDISNGALSVWGSCPRDFAQHAAFSKAWLDGKPAVGGQYLHVPCHDDPQCVRCDEMGWFGSSHRLYCRVAPGDRLWVKETWWQVPEPSVRQLRDGADTWPKPRGPQDQRLAYAVDGDDPDMVRDWGWKRKSSLFMPRWASRITLEITEVRVQRLQEISGDDAAAEGISTSVVDPSPRGIAPIYPKQYGSNVDVFRDLWQSINGEGSWDANPFVWAITFKRLFMSAARSVTRNRSRLVAKN